MNAKEELNQYRFKAKKANQQRIEYDEFMTRATKMTASFSESTARTNRISDKVGENAIELADLKAEWERLWVEAERERLNIVESINQMDEPYRTILMERYVHEKNFEEISVELRYSYAWTTHLHGEALQKFEELRTEKIELPPEISPISPQEGGTEDERNSEMV